MMECYVCNYPASDYRQFVGNGYSIIKCSKCGLEYTNPIPDSDIILSFYQGYKDVRADEHILRLNATNNLKTLLKYGWTPESATLDFGAGMGIFLEVAGENCHGVDFGVKSSRCIKNSLEELDRNEYKFITLWGVLEHLTDPRSIINKLCNLLISGGTIALTTVDAEGIIPYYYKPPEHLTYWTRSAFDFLAKENKLEIVEYRTYYMYQKSSIYLQRLLSRTPMEYVSHISNNLPDVIYVPTNEVFVVLKK
jgi:hypothetical protein